MLRRLGTWRWARRSRAMVRRLRSVTWRLRTVRPPPSPRVVPCVVLIRGIRYVGTRPIPSQRHALAPNATYLSRTPHIRPECHAPGPARDQPAPPRRVALCNGPFGWMVSIVDCVGTLAHIL